MANAEPDFSNYMEQLQAVEAEEARDEAMYNAHEVWKSTTWGGWVVTQLLTIGQHFRPFFKSVASAMAEDKSIGFRLLSHFVRMCLVGFVLLALYVIAQIIEAVIGKEIVAEQEIVIVEEIPRSRAIKEGIVEGERVLSPEEARERMALIDKEAKKAVSSEKAPRRSARDKKRL